MLVHIKDLIAASVKGHYALGAFNVHNLEIGLGIVRAAKEAKAPVILQVSETSLNYGGFALMMALLKGLAEEAGPAPVALHLDHGKNDAIVTRCIEAGFTSVMRDASDLPLNENIQAVQKIAAIAHAKGIWVQGELGRMLGKEGMQETALPQNHEQYETDPGEAREFAERTGIDALAVALGTLHGEFKGHEHVDIARLRAIRAKVSTPLVLHGASGLADAELTAAVEEGITIVNIDTELRRAFTTTLSSTLRAPHAGYDPRELLAPCRDAVQQVVAQKLAVLKSIGKA